MNEFKIADPLLRYIVYALGIMAAVIAGYHAIGLLKATLALVLDVLTPFLAALLLAYILAPLVTALQHRLHLGRLTGSLLLYLLLALIAFFAVFVLIPKVISELKNLTQIIKEAGPSMLSWLSNNRYMPLDDKFVSFVQRKIHDIDIDYQQLIGYLWPALKKLTTGGVKAVGEVSTAIFVSLRSLIGFIFFIIFVGIINFYLILDWDRIGPFIRKMVPADKRDRLFDILGKIDSAMGGFLRGQLSVAAIVGISFAAGLFALGFFGFPALRSYCILIGTMAAIAGFIPYLGAVIGVAPAIMIVLLTGGVAWQTKILTLAGVIGLFSLIQAFEGFILQPKIVGKGAGLHPLIVLLALIVGAQFGLGGIIIAVPLASLIRVLVRELYWGPLEKSEAHPCSSASNRRS